MHRQINIKLVSEPANGPFQSQSVNEEQRPISTITEWKSDKYLNSIINKQSSAFSILLVKHFYCYFIIFIIIISSYRSETVSNCLHFILLLPFHDYSQPSHDLSLKNYHFFRLFLLSYCHNRMVIVFCVFGIFLFVYLLQNIILIGNNLLCVFAGLFFGRVVFFVSLNKIFTFAEIDVGQFWYFTTLSTEMAAKTR